MTIWPTEFWQHFGSDFIKPAETLSYAPGAPKGPSANLLLFTLSLFGMKIEYLTRKPSSGRMQLNQAVKGLMLCYNVISGSKQEFRCFLGLYIRFYMIVDKKNLQNSGVGQKNSVRVKSCARTLLKCLKGTQD